MFMLSDCRYALRLLAKSPGFTALTTLVMAAGIGLSLYLFSFINTMVFKDLPFTDGDSLVQISQSRHGALEGNPLNYQDYQMLREAVQGLDEMGAYRNVTVNLSGRDGAVRYSGVRAEPNIFQLTRTQPLMGRTFNQAENLPGAEPVVVIGYDLWKSQFAGASDILERQVKIDGVSHRILGVMPQDYLFPNVAELWLPLNESPAALSRQQAGRVYGLAHLKSGYSTTEVNQQLALLMERLAQRYPQTNSGLGAYCHSIPLSVAEDGIAVVYSMQVAAVLILFLASFNVGNLLLSRAIERGKETAIRMALGAPRARLISQLLWESILICTLGGIIGLLLLAWGLEVTERVTASFSYGRQVFWFKFGIDAFTLKVFLLFLVSTIFITGFLPAWKNSGGDFNQVLRDGTRGALSKKTGRLNRVLVISEIFLSLTILIVAGVIVVSRYLEERADYGVKTDNILIASVLLPSSRYSQAQQQVTLFNQLQSQLQQQSALGDVMISTALPGMPAPVTAIAIDGKEYLSDQQTSFPRANHILVMPGSLAKLRVELRQGRYFSAQDEGQDKATVIVTDSFATAHFGDQSPLGKRIRVVDYDGQTPHWLTIVGVVRHVSQDKPSSADGRMPSVFRPYSQLPQAQMVLAMRLKSDVHSATLALRKTLQSLDPELPAYRIETYQAFLTRKTGPMRFLSGVFLLFGCATVLLTASGIYGLMSNTIRQRTQEIGVKRALGACEQRIARQLLLAGAAQLLWGGIPGLIVGCGLGYGMSQVMATPPQALFLIATLLILIIGAVVLTATWLPTRRALSMEPAVALRYE
ncbi:ABC transporter permease [Bowmanella denitrificans]|uniref:ABC transporter permease n=1 Tax=Bowmanella denitrificans TaxID=366582 RepID=A0ABN0XH59_9ALTE